MVDVVVPLPCLFYEDIKCFVRKHLKATESDMARCESCEHYLRFVAEMDKEEEEFWEWEEKVRANPDAYLRGEL